MNYSLAATQFINIAVIVIPRGRLVRCSLPCLSVDKRRSLLKNCCGQSTKSVYKIDRNLETQYQSRSLVYKNMKSVCKVIIGGRNR